MRIECIEYRPNYALLVQSLFVLTRGSCAYKYIDYYFEKKEEYNTIKIIINLVLICDPMTAC